MSALTVFDETGNKTDDTVTDVARIASELESIGVQFERWEANQPLADDADQEAVLAAYQTWIERLNERYGFQSIDVVSLNPGHPDKAAMRQKFLAEHTHSDFEVRFFVDGKGLFYLHVNAKVYVVLCEQGDLISVPADTTHWFDMGANPDFTCIRFFTAPDGWVGEFSGSDIATRFVDFDTYVALIA